MANLHKYDNLNSFLTECQKYVKAIEKYSGTDPLALWHQYLLWIDEHFVIDFKQETIFELILSACLCTFEKDERYKQDRRLIKLFIKFIHFQEDQNMHYETMLANGIGNKVADLYINWAFHFDMKDNFKKADHIFRCGISVDAEPIELLRMAHQNFGYAMSQRMLYKSNETKQSERLASMQKHLEIIAALRIDGTSPVAMKSTTLNTFDLNRLANMCIPFQHVQASVIDTRFNTPVTQNILDSARKMRREKRSKSMAGCRLDFTESAPNTMPNSYSHNSYNKGISITKNYPRKSLPQRVVSIKAYVDPDIGTYRKTMPGYDKIMLIPATNVAFSPEELKAYSWFKQRGIVNTFTTEQDKIWGISYNVPIRLADVFPRTNFPQTELNFPRISPCEYFNENGPHRFIANMRELYPKQMNEEFQIEEIMWKKRKLATSNDSKISNNTTYVNECIVKHKPIHNQTNNTDSKLSPIIEMDLSVFEESTTEVPKKRDSICPNSGVAWSKKRKSSIFPAFDALNDTCTTQMFSNLLHNTAVSTPKTKMAKFEVKSTDDQLPEEDKLKLFIDQSNSLTDSNSMQKKPTGSNPVDDFKFAIYQDTTNITRDLKAFTCKDGDSKSISGNKENVFIPTTELSKLSSNKSDMNAYEPNLSVTNDRRKTEKNVKENKESQRGSAFTFDIYTDKTNDIQKVVEHSHKTLPSNESSIINKENSEQKNRNNNEKKFIQNEVDKIRDMITSVLNSTRHDKSVINQSVFTDKTNENVQKVMDRTHKVQKCTELSMSLKKGSEFEKENQNSHTKNSLMNEVAKMSEKIASLLNATKQENSNNQSVFKEPSLMNLSMKKTDTAKTTNQTTYVELLDTTQEFEALEALCADSPPNQLSSTTPVRKMEQNLLKMCTPNKPTVNESVGHKSIINLTEHQSIATAKKSVIEMDENGNADEEDDDAEEKENSQEDIGRSIYVKQPELEFNENDADWKEVTQIADIPLAKNEYKVEEVNLDETRQRIDTHMLNLKNLDPFDPDVQKDVLADIGFIDELSGANNFNCIMMNIVQPLKPRSTIDIDGETFQVRKLIGTGAFGKVFSAECPKTKEWYALKQQRPPNLWEYYVCLQIHKRIRDESIRKGFMAVDYAVIGNNATIYASKFSKYGTILNVCNKVKQVTNKCIEECIVMLLVKQMLTIVEQFHKAKFIHADIKPDNFLLMDRLSMNYENPEIVLQLIDFGQSIDLTYFSNHVFWAKVKTENFICTQMMEDKPWTFHCDLFCLASTIYTMVAGKYMVVTRRTPTEPYKPQKLPRYVNATLWEEIFDTLINIPSLKKMPSLSRLQELLDNELKIIGSKKLTEAINKFNKALDS